MSGRLNQEREAQLQPQRIAHAKKQLSARGIEIIYEDYNRIDFMWKGSKIMFYPYSGWHSGKTIQDGRGLKHLLDQLGDNNA